MSPSTPERFVGIDIAKAKLDVAVDDDPLPAVPRTPEGVAELAARLAPLAPTSVVMEATGGLEAVVAAGLARAGLPVVVINPKRARAFAKAEGVAAKTDRLDAKLLARFGRKMRPAVRPLPDESARALDALLDRRRQLVGMRTMEQDRLGSAAAGRVRRDLEGHIRWLDEAIARVDEELDQQVRQSPLWQADDALSQSIPGVGPVVSRTLLAGVPELGKVSNKAAAHLWGWRRWPTTAAGARGRGASPGPRGGPRGAVHGGGGGPAV
jgi:transposase